MSSQSRLSRRHFLRLLGGTAAAAAAAQACRALGLEQASPTASPTTPLEVTPMPTSTPSASASPEPTASPTPASMIGRVALVKTDDRTQGVRRALDLLGIRPVQGRRVLLKPNFNSADPAPGSTHPDVLRSLVEWLWGTGARSITLGDRSGMGDTRQVMESVGVFNLAQELGFEALVYDELGADGWVLQQPQDSHWSRGFPLARPVLEAEAVVLACCLKTHRYGGHFTLSLKNSVGMVAKRVPGDGYDYMNELHGSVRQRTMIAEINAAYAPALVVMDGVEAFVSGGPDQGTKVHSQVVLAGADRVALDAVGVALLRYHGTTDEVSAGPVFGQEQIARAVELGLGVEGPDGIQFLTDDPESEAYAAALRPILMAA